ncbi:MAG: hypothetical protein ABJG33_01290 [Balneola sp.]
MSISFSIDDSSFRKKLQNAQRDMLAKAKNVVELTAREAVNYAKSHQGETEGASVNAAGNYVPVAKRKKRKSHPGGWGDITGNLANSIQTGEITITQSTIETEFGVLADIDGSMEYAEILDERDGYSVLAGADKQARKSLNKYGKEIVQ